MLLAATTDKIQLVTDAARTVDTVVTYMDATNADPPAVKGSTSGRQAQAITTATTTDILSAPAASTLRNVQTVNVRNKDTLSVTVTVLLDLNGTDYELHEVTLLAGETLIWTKELGWYVIPASNKLDVLKRVTADVTNATTSWADITALETPIVSGKVYAFQAWLIHQTNATTTGARFGVTGPTMTILGSGFHQITASVTAATFGMSAAVTAADTGFVVETTGPGAVNMTAIIGGYVAPSADGTFKMRCQSEVAIAGGLVVKAGSWLWLREFDN